MPVLDDPHFGLTLTRCDRCGRRQFCAVEGYAMCESCCPGAVQAAREDAREAHAEAQRERERARQALVPEELLSGEYDGPPVPFSQVAHLF